MEKLTMYMVTHKQIEFIPKGRTPIFVGNGNCNLYLRDNVKENISERNENYCELTALYWIWKNDKHSDFVSIEHYRRFFSKKYFLTSIIEKKEINKILEKDYVITSKPISTKMTTGEFYSARHFKNDLLIAKEAIKKFFPEYIESFETVMNGHDCALYNMCAMKKEYFDAYCEWLFKVLFYVESKVDLSDRTPYQKRAFGFLSERLFNVWLLKNEIKVYCLPIYYRLDNGIDSFFKTIKCALPKKPYDPKKPKL